MLLYDPHMCVITETWLHNAIYDEEIVPPGYQLYRCDRASRGGGVAIVTGNGVDVSFAERIESL